MTAMTPQLIGALAMFAFASSITPGPNNAMLLASGANFGLRATVPHLLGVVFGFLALLLAVGFGLGGLFTAYPVLHEVLKWVGGAYLVYLAVRLAMSRSISTGKSSGRPMTFFEAFLFQAVNPKGWAMALGAVMAFVPPQHYLANILIAAAVFGTLNAPCVVAWTSFGVGLRRFLDRPRALRAFNISMAILLVASLYPLFL